MAAFNQNSVTNLNKKVKFTEHVETQQEKYARRIQEELEREPTMGDVSKLIVGNKKVADLFMKYKDDNDHKQKPCTGREHLENSLWPHIASVVIKGMKSEALDKLIEKVDKFKSNIQQEEEQSNFSKPSKQKDLNPFKQRSKQRSNNRSENTQSDTGSPT